MWVSYMGLTSPALACEFFTANATWEALNSWVTFKPMYGVQGTQQKKKKKQGGGELEKIEFNRVKEL